MSLAKRSRKSLFTILLIFFVLAGCTSEDDPNATSSSDGAFATATLADSDATLITAEGELHEPLPPPVEFLDVLLEATENDIAAREAAVLEALRMMLGEPNNLGLYEESMDFEQGWMFSSIAAGLYEESDNQEFKAQFEDLMARVFPVEERMLPYSAEDDQSANAGKAAAPSNVLAQEFDCRAIRTRGFPPRGSGEAPICQLYRQFIADGNKYSVFFPIENRENASYMAYVEAAVEALQESQATYAAYGPVPGINLVFTTLANPGNAQVWASVPFKWLGGGGERTSLCPISVFPRSLSLPVEDFKQTVAHEVFHCFTYLRKPTTFSTQADWYMEGMAEHFSNLVYPENNFEIRKHLYYFDTRSPYASLLNFKYTTWIFFQYLGNQYGNAYNVALLDAMPAMGSKSDMARALASFDDMQAIFSEFGQAYLNEEIMDSDGSLIPNTVYFDRDLDYDLREGGSLFLSTQTMVLNRYRFQFADGQEYDLIKDFTGQEGKFVWHLEDEDHFIEVPDSVDPQCGEPENYIGLFTSLPGDATFGGGADLDFEVEKAEDGRMDCCLVGTWEQPASQNRSNLQTVLGGELQVVSVSGRSVLVITEERTTYFAPEGYSVTVRDPDDKTIVMTIQGASSGTFILPDDEEGVIQSTGEEAAFIMTGTVDGTTVTFPVGFPGFTAEGLSFDYDCSSTRLTSYPGDLAPFSSSTYDRVSEIPMTPQPPDDLPSSSGSGDEDPSDIVAPELCSAIEVVDFLPGTNQATWTIANSGSEIMELVSLSLDWPSENGAWQAASLNGAEFWSGNLTSRPQILESGFTGDASSRYLNPASSSSLQLDFANAALGSNGYILVLDFANGCLTADVR